MRDYILAALAQRGQTGATVRAFTFDAGQTYDVRLANGQACSVSMEWGDNPETILAVILRRLGLALDAA